MGGRIPIRARVTAGFALALAVVLAGIGAFLYLSFRSGLDRSIDQGLRSRAGDVAALVAQADTGLTQSGQSRLTAQGEAFAQILDARGRVFDATPLVRGDPLLDPARLRAALRGSMIVSAGPIRRLTDPVRLFATPVRAQGRRLVIVVGVSLAQRDASLQSLGALLLICGGAALLLASAVGYLAVAGALRPIEAMRSRAGAISGGALHQRLPVPAARDEVARLGDTLNAMLARLETSFAREQQFVSDASHELRTPLGILKVELELALRGDHDRDELVAAIRSAATETDRVIALAEDLLVIARADQGRLPVRRAPHDLAVVADGVRRRFALRAAEQGRLLRTDVPAGWSVEVDRPRLEQALGNLVDNALRHGAGTVTLHATRRAGAVELHVTDRGNGLSPAFAPEAFHRFTREDRGRSGAGSGLGLAIVEAIATAHGGRVAVSSREGETDFSITLPVVARVALP